jgi:hypothetical protein
VRIFLIVVVLFTIAEAVDTFWYDGRYGHALWQYVDQESQQVAGQTFIHFPTLSRYWKIP